MKHGYAFALVLGFFGFSLSVAAIEHAEILEIEKELQFYFEEVGSFDDDGNYMIFDLESVKARAAQGDMTATRVLDLYFNGSSDFHAETPIDFAKCVAGKFFESYGSIAHAFLSGEIFDWLKKKEWRKAAELMFKILRAAGKSTSAASLAIEAGIYGWQCRGEW